MISMYKDLLELQEANFTLIEHEDAMVATVYLITKKDGTKLIVKICAHDSDYQREVHFLRFFAKLLPVPEIIHLVPPQKNIHGAILMQYLKGSILTAKTLSHNLAYDMGYYLAKIHACRTEEYGDPTHGNLTKDPVIPFTQKFEEGLDECKHHLPKSYLDIAYHFFKTNLFLLDHVDGPCIVHRDYRPGNVMAHEGKIQGIIDWSSSRFGFAEVDFCSMEHENWARDTKESFLAGYQSLRPIPPYARVMPLLRLDKAIATIGFTVKRNTWQNIHSPIYQYNRLYLDTFIGTYPTKSFV